MKKMLALAALIISIGLIVPDFSLALDEGGLSDEGLPPGEGTRSMAADDIYAGENLEVNDEEGRWGSDLSRESDSGIVEGGALRSGIIEEGDMEEGEEDTGIIEEGGME